MNYGNYLECQLTVTYKKIKFDNQILRVINEKNSR
jgi:hypothetical protein